MLASEALTALCASSSGEDGCAYAEQEEIDVLLQALQSPCMNVRDAALRVGGNHSGSHQIIKFLKLLGGESSLTVMGEPGFGQCVRGSLNNNAPSHILCAGFICRREYSGLSTPSKR